MDSPQIYNKKPTIFNTATIKDIYLQSLRELYYVRNPQLVKKNYDDEKKIDNFIKQNNFYENWIYFPWNNILLRTVSEEIYFELRTARNKNIITYEEQIKFRKSIVGIIGLSVGSATVLSLIIGGGPRSIRMSDFDTIDITNLNRIKANIFDIGENKSSIIARKIWEIDPYANLKIWQKGIDKNSIEYFLTKPKKINIFIDAMDSIELKILSRLYCKKHKIPVLMATDNGNSVILDVERYDLNKNIYPFHGLLGNINFKNYNNLLREDWIKISSKIIGINLLEDRMVKSVKEFGISLSGIPQLGLASDISGAVVTLAARNIILNNTNIESGRYFFPFENLNFYKINKK